MASVLVIYGVPKDPAHFDDYYHRIHVPLAAKIPNLKGVTLSTGPVAALAGEAAHLVARLDFADMATLQASMGSAEGQATAGDLANFASGGARILAFDDQAIA
ncbi:EthD family reductase [Zavarzinia compransoris]|uniref:EthD family reductase n=1 Tax=Zavarzinia compransoris TaxID=1264899 RepID=A0A317E9T8_9PROT|nr:EthD family reductase [Zavarzinia compransoris]PWR21885.1 EthD family reductase [Zavarzinia compransoris]TDP45309.1 uncharacterized protein (TIGR02118 family) [Zavarzinia compransoris]